MNKTEKLICLVLGAILAWWIWSEMGRSKERARIAAEQAAIAATNEVEKAEGNSDSRDKNVASPLDAAKEDVTKGDATQADAAKGDATFLSREKKASTASLPAIPEKIVTLENDDVKLELSSWGAVVKKVTLKKYAKNCGDISEENPAVVLDFSDSPLGALIGVDGLSENVAYEIKAQTESEIVFATAQFERKISLAAGYQITYADTFSSAPSTSTSTYSLSLGAMRMGDSKNDLLSVDSWACDAGKNKPGVIHHGDDDSPLKPYLVGGLTGGCSGSKSAAGMPETTTVEYPGAQQWIAVKNRFFVTALASCSEANAGFAATVKRDVNAANYKPESVSVSVNFKGDAAKRTSVFFVGPKKQSLLWDLGMKDVMEFGMWRWLCYPLVWVLNLFHGWIPNFGVAIILLTILVRLLFWPLTHKSTVGMKKMQELQPKMKAIQAQFKDNPQRLQQETWALYKAEKVNPASSCLPMLIQIPVFIALFNVLRSAVELRYAPFLWIADLSEPEALFASWFPFGGLNILPILMAVSTGLQSAFTPSTGDKSQQKMMMIFMPAMMLFMFYSFPSALSLYWFLSNLFSIVQMWLIRRSTAKEQAAKAAVFPDQIIDPPTTRQMRRHS